ncbi:GntR family transcriptional regulator [Levilactobacillus zymae]|uniref:GntR family transcriptional regulator n=1 Tax=Levilactobacillus zymae TaxID=267363 RepID=A0ABQ0X1B6_9LACO|nr:GntR family transcriptional regulator [Levilactobacillus zymae]KRL13695.1 transcriptional regulator [Levilactobacillus zymae DSM 19395]QFR62132.1 GntR family transcriptional regulator [Levilactobacillus zymae]GEO73026.1 GntR family transcriptional regulator [Levilactobacillus zymae]
MQFDDKVPIYYQIKNNLYHRIVAGDLAPGEKLPAVRQLAVDLTVNVNTVQRALSEMVTEQVLTSKRGVGNFVTMDTARITALKQRLSHGYIERLYTQLHALRLSDGEIVTAIQAYITANKEE